MGFKKWLGDKAQAAALALFGFYAAADASPFLPEGWILDELLLIPVAFGVYRLIGLARWAKEQDDAAATACAATLRAQITEAGSTPRA